MKTALDILETNNFYRHLILFKLYIEHNGAINNHYGNLRKDIKELLKDEFSMINYNTAVNYLDNANYTKGRGGSMTIYGVNYFENFIKDFSELQIEDQDILEKELPKEYFDFFKFTNKANTVLSFINNIIKVNNNFN
jgi:hypothetical protein